MIGSQCKGCTKYKKGKCTRVGTSGEPGVCWMERSEGEYELGFQILTQVNYKYP